MGVKLDSPIYGQLPNGMMVPLAANGASQCLVTMTVTHHEIHEGISFEYFSMQDLAINTVWDIQITTPSGPRRMNFIAHFDTENETRWWFYENVTIGLAGTTITPHNMNRDSSNRSQAVLAYHVNANLAAANADTVVASATTLWDGISGSGRDAGSVSHSDELILQQGEDYCLRFEATAAGYVNLHLMYDEHED